LSSGYPHSAGYTLANVIFNYTNSICCSRAVAGQSLSASAEDGWIWVDLGGPQRAFQKPKANRRHGTA